MVCFQFDLVCSRQFYVSLSSSFFLLGVLVGAVTSGVLSDRFSSVRKLSEHTLQDLLYQGSGAREFYLAEASRRS